MELLDLPPDVLVRVLTHLDCPALASIAQTCRTLNSLAEQEEPWLHLCRPWAPRGLVSKWLPRASSAKALFRLLRSLEPLVGVWEAQNLAPRGGVLYIAWADYGVNAYRIIPAQFDGALFCRCQFGLGGTADGSTRLRLVQLQGAQEVQIPGVLLWHSKERKEFSLEEHPLPPSPRSPERLPAVPHSRSESIPVTRGLSRGSAVLQQIGQGAYGDSREGPRLLGAPRMRSSSQVLEQIGQGTYGTPAATGEPGPRAVPRSSQPVEGREENHRPITGASDAAEERGASASGSGVGSMPSGAEALPQGWQGGAAADAARLAVAAQLLSIPCTRNREGSPPVRRLPNGADLIRQINQGLYRASSDGEEEPPSRDAATAAATGPAAATDIVMEDVHEPLGSRRGTAEGQVGGSAVLSSGSAGAEGQAEEEMVESDEEGQGEGGEEDWHIQLPPPPEASQGSRGALMAAAIAAAHRDADSAILRARSAASVRLPSPGLRERAMRFLADMVGMSPSGSPSREGTPDDAELERSSGKSRMASGNSPRALAGMSIAQPEELTAQARTLAWPTYPLSLTPPRPSSRDGPISSSPFAQKQVLPVWYSKVTVQGTWGNALASVRSTTVQAEHEHGRAVRQEEKIPGPRAARRPHLPGTGAAAQPSERDAAEQLAVGVGEGRRRGPDAVHDAEDVPESLQRLEGLWTGVYGPHGVEVLNVTCTDEEIIARKVTGDPNVPCGEISFKAYLSSKKTAEADRVWREVSASAAAVSDDNEGGDDGAPLRAVAMYMGNGRVADHNFQHPMWVPGKLFVDSANRISFIWEDFNFLIRFKRLHLDELIPPVP